MGQKPLTLERSHMFTTEFCSTLDTLIKDINFSQRMIVKPPHKQLPPNIDNIVEIAQIVKMKSDNKINNQFVATVSAFIKDHYPSDKAFYDTADISKQTFSNFMSEKNLPSRNTLISILFAMKLPIEEIQLILNNYGYRLSDNNSRDKLLTVIYTYSLQSQISFSVKDINNYILDYSLKHNLDIKPLSTNSFLK